MARRIAVDDTWSSSRAAWPSRAHELVAEHLEPELGAHLLEQRDVAPPAMAEVEVLAHDDLLGACRQSTSTVWTKSSADSCRPLLVEAHDERVVDPGRLEQLELLVQVGQQQRRRVRVGSPGPGAGRR